MKILLTLVVSFFTTISFCQYTSNLSSDAFGPFLYNPASFGTWNKISVNAIHQVSDFGIENPGKLFLFNGEVKFKYGKTNFSSGVGLNYYQVENYSSRTSTASVNYNFQFSLKKVHFSFGILAGIQNVGFGLIGSAQDQSKFTIGSGFMMYGEKFMFGISSTNMNTPNYENLNYWSSTGYQANAGYRFELGSKFSLFPTFNFISQDGFAGVSGMLFAELTKPKLIGGIGFNYNLRNLKGAIGYELKNVSVMYVFAQANSILTNANFLSHEIRLSYRIRNEKETCSTCPIWN